VWSYAGQLTGPIFTFGAVSGQVAQAEAAQKAALYNYQLTIQSAFADVESALVANAKIKEQLAAQEKLVAALKELDFGNPTRLYDALDQSLDRLTGVEGRRVIVVLTDGEDNSSKVGQGDVLNRAIADEVMIYGIGLESNYFNGMRQVRTNPDRVVRRLAEETGGGYYLLKETADLNSTFTRIAQELRSQYVLGFSPTVLDGKVHKLLVNVKRPGMKARARKSYVASSDAAPGRVK